MQRGLRKALNLAKLMDFAQVTCSTRRKPAKQRLSGQTALLLVLPPSLRESRNALERAPDNYHSKGSKSAIAVSVEQASVRLRRAKLASLPGRTDAAQKTGSESLFAMTYLSTLLMSIVNVTRPAFVFVPKPRAQDFHLQSSARG